MDKILPIVVIGALHIKTNIHMLFALYQRFMLKCNKWGYSLSAFAQQKHECVIRKCFAKTR